MAQRTLHYLVLESRK